MDLIMGMNPVSNVPLGYCLPYMDKGMDLHVDICTNGHEGQIGQ